MKTTRFALISLLALGAVAPIASAFTVTTYDFEAGGQFTVADGQAHYWHNGDYMIYDLATGSTVSHGSPSDFAAGGDGAFALYDKLNGTFYGGSYNFGSNSAKVYQYGNGAWDISKTASMDNVFSASAYNGSLYISGLPQNWNAAPGQNSSIFRLNADGSTSTLINSSGNSGQLAIAANGDFYYAAYAGFGLDGILYRWDADTIAGVTDTPLTAADASLAITINGGGSGLAIDDAGNIFFIANGGSMGSYIGLLDSANDTFDVFLDENDLGMLGIDLSWPGFLEITGDVFNGGELFFSPGYMQGVVGIQVPEPATYALFASFAVLLLTLRLRRGRERK